jgi:hypothetical protein
VRALLLGAVAFSISLLGTLLLRDEATRNTGELLLVGAGLMSVIAWGRQSWAELVITNYELRITNYELRKSILSWYWIGTVP